MNAISAARTLKYPWRYYIWDLGGTLLDNYEGSACAFVQTLAEFGLRARHDPVYDALRVSTDQAIAEFAPNVPDFLERYRELEAHHLDDPLLFPGADEVLTAVIAAGGANFLISHRDNQVLDIINKAGIADKFTEVVTKDNGFARKPNPQSFNYLIEKYQLDRSETVTVGDRPIDIEAGVGAGIATVYFDPPRVLDLATISIVDISDLLS
jgi:HAD superfamily hydrolase (TIGR01549 family)